jgi:hypothetical protein
VQLTLGSYAWIEAEGSLGIDGYTDLYEALVVPGRTEYGLGPQRLLLDHYSIEGLAANEGGQNQGNEDRSLPTQGSSGNQETGKDAKSLNHGILWCGAHA